MSEERRGGRASRGAKADAEHLRERYGAAAETWCRDALAGLPANDPRRAWVLQIAEALRRIPVRQSANARICVRPQGSSYLFIAEP